MNISASPSPRKKRGCDLREAKEAGRKEAGSKCQVFCLSECGPRCAFNRFIVLSGPFPYMDIEGMGCRLNTITEVTEITNIQNPHLVNENAFSGLVCDVTADDRHMRPISQRFCDVAFTVRFYCECDVAKYLRNGPLIQLSKIQTGDKGQCRLRDLASRLPLAAGVSSTQPSPGIFSCFCTVTLYKYLFSSTSFLFPPRIDFSRMQRRRRRNSAVVASESFCDVAFSPSCSSSPSAFSYREDQHCLGMN